MPPKRFKRNPQEHLRQVLDASVKSSEQFVGSARILYNARVIDNNDPIESRRVKVRINDIDSGTSDENLPWCISGLPSLFHIIPDVNEHVIVCVTNPWNPSVGRYYFGPVLSHDYVKESYVDSLTEFGLVVENE